MPAAEPDAGTASEGQPRQKRDRQAWWKIHLFRGMANDLRQRMPYYVSDWVDAWDYRVVPATVYMYFAKYVWTVSPAFKTMRITWGFG